MLRHNLPHPFTSRFSRLLLLGALIQAAFAGGVAHAAYVVGKHNVLLIIADDVGVDQLSYYVKYYNTTTRTDDDMKDSAGKPLKTACTRTIEKLAASGVTFVNAWGYPTCSPTRSSVYTGMHAFRTGVYSPNDASQFCPNTRTIAEVLRGVSYANGLFGKWHLGETAPPDDAGAVMADDKGHGWTYYDYGCLGSHLNTYYDSSYYGGYATFDTAENAKNWINSQTGNWMATVAFNAAHMTDEHTGAAGNKYWSFDGEGPPTGYGWCPYTITSASSDAEIYRATLSVLDRQMSVLLDGISASALAKTTIIFIGDNGTDDAIVSFGSFAGKAKGTVHEGGVNVPMIIADGYAYKYGTATPSWYGTGRVVSPGRTSTALVQTIDLYSTVSAIADGDGACGVDGVSLVPILENTASSVRSASYVISDKDEAVAGDFGTWGIYKLIITPAGSSNYELYNLSTDRWETTNLLTGSPGAIALSMKSSLLKQRDKFYTGLPAGCHSCP